MSLGYADGDQSRRAAISDRAGDLLFYTSGSVVWNREHEQMPNGLIEEERLYLSRVVVVPHPGDDRRYYIFGVRPNDLHDDPLSGLYYAEVNMALDGGRGDVTTKLQKIHGSVTSVLSAYHNVELGYSWLTVHKWNSNEYISIKIDKRGIDPEYVSSRVGVSLKANTGQFKISADGRYAAMGLGDVFTSNSERAAQLCDFNPRTGVLSNPLEFSMPVRHRGVSGVEFSPDATKLYLYQRGSSYEEALYQYDLTLAQRAAIPDSRLHIETITRAGLNELQLAADGKIYASKGGGSTAGLGHLAVIQQPNQRGAACKFEDLGLDLAGARVEYTTPLFVQGEAFFKTDYTYGPVCARGQTEFTVTNDYRLERASWHFGDGTTIEGTNVRHQFSAAGTYDVSLLAEYPDRVDTVVHSVEVHPFTPLDLGPDTTLCFGAELSSNRDFVDYQWSNGDTTHYTTAKVTGSYSLTVTNEFGCKLADTVAITVQDSIEVGLPDTVVIDYRDSVALSPAKFDSYVWNTGDTTANLTVTSPGWYSVAVRTTEGCTAAQSARVIYPTNYQPPAPTWQQLNPLPTGATGRDVTFIDRNIGFIANDDHLLRTTDGGKQWQIVPGVGPTRQLTFLYDFGYALGPSKLYRSTHAGGGWNTVVNGLARDLNSMTIISHDTLYLSDSRDFFFSHDGGVNWTKRPLPREVEVLSTHFLSESTGLAACRSGKLLRTEDGGESWEYVIGSPTRYSTADFTGLYFINNEIGLLIRDPIGMYRTTDGGKTWTELAGRFDTVYDLYFLNDKIGFAATEYGGILRTADAGLTWKKVGNPQRTSFTQSYGVHFIDPEVGYLTGARGSIAKTTDGGITWDPYSFTYLNINYLTFLNREVGYLSASGKLFKTRDRGDSWQALASPEGNLHSIPLQFINDSVGFAADRTTSHAPHGKLNVYKTRDGGISWARITSDHRFYDKIESVTFLSEQLGFVTTSSTRNPTYKTTDGGQSWRLVSTERIADIAFITDSIAYGRNDRSWDSKLYKSTDGGESWTVIRESEQDINSFHFVDEQRGYYVGEYDEAFATTDGGSTWSSLTLPHWGDYIDVKFVNYDTGYVLHEYGYLYRTDDAGRTWSQSNSLYGIEDITMVGPDIFLSGKYGRLLASRQPLPDPTVPTDPPTEVVVDSIYTDAAVLVTTVPLSMDTMYVYFEYGTTSEKYDHRVEAGVLFGKAGREVVLKLQDLAPGTTYYGRFSYVVSKQLTIGSEVAFTTDMTNSLLDPSFPTVEVAPNPVIDQLRISVLDYSGTIFYTLLGAEGRQHATGQFSGSLTLSTAAFPVGIYWLSLVDATGSRVVHKLVIAPQ